MERFLLSAIWAALLALGYGLGDTGNRIVRSIEENRSLIVQAIKEKP